MALSRKFLESKGIDSNVIDEIIEAHVEALNSVSKDESDPFTKDYLASKGIAKSLVEEIIRMHNDTVDYSKLKKEFEDYKASVAKNSNQDYDTLKKEFEDYKASVEKEKSRKAKEDAYIEILKDAGVPERHFAKIIKYSDVDAVELDKDGKIKDAKDILAAIKEEWGDHIETTDKKGADTSQPPKNTGGKATMTKDEIMAIKDSAVRQKAILDNKELFGL